MCVEGMAQEDGHMTVPEVASVANIFSWNAYHII
jgi:hypothetical protein